MNTHIFLIYIYQFLELCHISFILLSLHIYTYINIFDEPFKNKLQTSSRTYVYSNMVLSTKFKEHTCEWKKEGN